MVTNQNYMSTSPISQPVDRNLDLRRPDLRIIITTLFLMILPLGASASLIANTSNTTTLTRGLVGYWTFDGNDTAWTSATAGTTRDKSGQGNTGTLTNMNQSTSPVMGKIGQGMKFDGSSYVTLSSPINLTGAKTVAFWVTFNSGSPTEVLLGNDAYTGYFPAIVGGSSIYITDWSSFPFVNVGGFTVGQWYHLALSSNGTTVTVYKNGISQGTMSNINTTIKAIGAYSDGGAGHNGSMDDVRIYNRALSANEVQQLYKQGAAKVGVSPSTSSGQLTQGLVGYWTFDGANTVWTSSSAGTATDGSGNGNTGTLTNMNQSTSPVPGKIGQGLKFDGTKYVTSGAVFSSLGTSNQPYSIAGWVKTTASNYGNVIHVSQSSDGSGWCVSFVTYNSPGNLQAHSWNGAPVTATGATTLSAGNWYHFVNTWDSSGGLRIYVNGVLDGATSQSTFSASGGSDYVFAGLGDSTCAGSTGNYFNGSMDDVRIYNRALSANEVQQLYNSTKGSVAAVSPTKTLTSGLVGYWTFDGNSTNWATGKTNDVSGQGNTGTLTSMSTTTSTVMGKIGQGLQFDGSADRYVNVGSNLDFSSGLKFSISFWVKGNTTQVSGAGLIARGNGGGGEQYSLDVNAGVFRFYTYLSDGVTVGVNISASEGPTSTWKHLVVTYNALANSGIMYLNGVSVNSGTTGASLQIASHITSIGSRQSASGSYNLPFNGSIDDVRIYNRALSANEVMQLYKIGL